MRTLVCKSGMLDHQLILVHAQFGGQNESASGLISYNQLNEKLMVSTVDKIL